MRDGLGEGQLAEMCQVEVAGIKEVIISLGYRVWGQATIYLGPIRLPVTAGSPILGHSSILHPVPISIMISLYHCIIASCDV